MYLQTKDANIYYQRVGKGANLMMLHGWGNDVSSFWGVVEELAKDFTLYLVDLPGFGRSEMRKSAFSNLDYAMAIDEFIRKLKIKSPAVLGHSVGGRVAIKLAANYPVVDKLILEDAAGVKPKQDVFKPAIIMVSKVGRFFLPNIFGLKEKVRDLVYLNLESDYLSAGKMRKTLSKLLDEDLTPELGKIACDTLILWGEEDRTSASSVDMARMMYRKIPNSRLEFIMDAGHFPHIEKPVEFVYWVRNFLLN